VRYNEVMIAWDILVWWYTEGWRLRLTALKGRFAGMVDYFSIDLLLRTLFAPFRQISAGRVDGPLDVQMKAFLDRLVSRVIGGFVRLFMIVIGAVAIGLSILIDGLLLATWAFVPLMPLLGLILFFMGWVPWSR
jgi:hypothetical protein